jgi:cytochrome c biogenesis protein CcmG/thiol:disulfide interchange protein DsbE
MKPALNGNYEVCSMTEIVDSTTPAPAESEAGQKETAKGTDKSINWSSAAIWTGVIAILALLGWGLVRTNAERPSDVAPDFEVLFFDGYEWEGADTLRLSDLKGRPVVLNFWASWCVECKIEADLLEQTWRDYRDQGVVFLGVAYVDVEPKSIAYLEEFDITYPNAPDLRSSVSSKYEVTGVPETFFIDPNGDVVHIQIGPVSERMLTGLLDQMLAAEQL